MKHIIGLVLVLGLSGHVKGIISEKQAFEEFIKEQNRQYSSNKEKEYRFEIFKQNLKLIQENDGSLMGKLKGQILLGANIEEPSIKVEMNDFGDLSKEEFSRMYLMEDLEELEANRKMQKRKNTEGENLNKDKVLSSKISSPDKRKLLFKLNDQNENNLIIIEPNSSNFNEVSLKRIKRRIFEDKKVNKPKNSQIEIFEIKTIEPKKEQPKPIEKKNVQPKPIKEENELPKLDKNKNENQKPVKTKSIQKKPVDHNKNQKTPMKPKPSSPKPVASKNEQQNLIKKKTEQPKPASSNKEKDKPVNQKDPPQRVVDINSLKKKVDWKKFASVVKSQKGCGSCYVFSMMGTIETSYLMKTGKTIDLSHQEGVDCDKKNFGCKGGYPARIAQYILKEGIAFESDYPYKAKNGSCSRSEKNRFRSLRGLTPVGSSNFELLEALQKGPVSICMAFPTGGTMRFYKSGVYNGVDCTKKSSVNHCLVAVGYDLLDKIPYIEIRNSWGKNWGDKGFFKLAIGTIGIKENGICKISGHKSNSRPEF